ncbi:hypothetical protein [Nocardioides houyundeii]|uniref:hypothetical protein n=1 Tax=Nocardioides houyundeii TaxID=2045452 RepID=UPI000DF1EE50|nr:hypothetical protein [Nocardioides houyundeii]
MTDDPDPQARPVPDDDGEHDAVRRLLAASRVTSGTPDAVTTRLDQALAALLAERSSTVGHRGSEPDDGPSQVPSQAVVVPLPVRRRRVLGWSVAAAAAVVIGGLAVGSGLGSGLPSPGDQDDTAFSDAQGPVDAGPEQVEPETGPQAGQDQRGDSPAPGRSPAPLDGAVALSRDSLERDLVLLRAAGPEPEPTRRLADAGCLPPVRGERFSVRLDGRAAVVVLGPVRADRQRARVYLCGAERPVASALLPAP